MSNCGCSGGSCSTNLSVQEKKQVHREMQCPKCGENNVFDGVLQNQFVQKIACQCGQLITVQTENELKTGHIE